MKKIYSLILLLTLLTLPLLVSAVASLGTMAEAVAKEVVIVGTWIVVIMWVATGILFLTAQGDPGKLNAGKTALFAAIAGTVLIILANTAISFVRNSFGL